MGWVERTHNMRDMQDRSTGHDLGTLSGRKAQLQRARLSDPGHPSTVSMSTKIHVICAVMFAVAIFTIVLGALLPLAAWRFTPCRLPLAAKQQ